MDDDSALSVAFVPGVTVTKWTKIWAERHPQIPLNVIPTDQTQQVAVVRDGTAQLSFVRLPIDSEGLHVITLYRERAVAVAAKDHLIAAAENITLADIAGETQHSAEMKHHDRGPFDLVAAGVGVLVVPQSIARLQSRKDVVVRPITDALETEIALVWLTEPASGADPAGVAPVQDRGEMIEEFIGIVRGRTAQSSRSMTRAGESATKLKPTTSKHSKLHGDPKKKGAPQPSGGARAASRKRAEVKRKHRGR